MVCVAEPELSSSESEDDSVHLEENQNSSTIISKDGNIVWKRQPLQQSTGRRTVCNIVRSQRGPTRYAIRNIDTIASAFQLFMNNNHSRTSPKNFGGAMKFCPNFVTFAQIMILEYISDMTKKLSEFLRQKPILS